MNISRNELIHKAYPNVVTTNSDEQSFDVNGNLVEIDEDTLSEKLTELQTAEPMRLLRQERNWKLNQTDWRASSDLTLSSEWSTYRQALRDLPSTANPTLDSNGNLQGVTWPDEPT